MKKNIYFSHMLHRENLLKKFLFNFLTMVASYPRLVSEVFLRRNFGERYFTSASVICAAFIMALLPVLFHAMPSLPIGHYSSGQSGFWMKYTTWYMFLAAFLYCSWQRRAEIKRSASSFDFSRFSLYAGDVDARFFQIRPFGWQPNIRLIETIYEPGVFFLIGLVLWCMGQRIGILLLINSLFYSLSYVATYWHGDNFILDRIDEMIFNEEMSKSFIDDINPQDARGVRFYCKKPLSKEQREKLMDSFLDDADDAAEVI
jgi:hypothetical protein